MTIKTTEAEQLAKYILRFVNSYEADYDIFAEMICRSRRTLQQSTMRLFIATIRRMAENGTDDRNKQAVELAKKISEIADDYPLLLI